MNVCEVLFLPNENAFFFSCPFILWANFVYILLYSLINYAESMYYLLNPIPVTGESFFFSIFRCRGYFDRAELWQAVVTSGRQLYIEPLVLKAIFKYELCSFYEKQMRYGGKFYCCF